MLTFLKWLLTPMWLKRYLSEDNVICPCPVETTEMTDSDDNVVITSVNNEDTSPVDTEDTDDTPPNDSNVEELWGEGTEDIVSNMMWDATEDIGVHMDLDAFINDLNKNAEMSKKQKDQIKNYVIDDLFTEPVKEENTTPNDQNTDAVEPPKKKKKKKKTRKLRYNLRRSGY